MIKSIASFIAFGALLFPEIIVEPPATLKSVQVDTCKLEGIVVKDPIEISVRIHAAKYQIDPQLVFAMIHVESTGRAQARSSKGAYGLMQLMPKTAKSLGINPYTVDGNIEAGVKYISQQIRKYKSVKLGLAAYNAGPSNVNKYGDIPPFKETQRYVSLICNRYACG